jgi:hypothetical protein
MNRRDLYDDLAGYYSRYKYVGGRIKSLSSILPFCAA